MGLDTRACVHPIGTLVVVVLKARHLHDKSFRKADVFCELELDGNFQQTKIDRRGGQTPLWDEEIRYPMYKNGSRILQVGCWSKQRETLGSAVVDLTQTLRTNGEFDEWVPLQINGVYRGEVYLEITWFSAATDSTQKRPSKIKSQDRLTREDELPPAEHTEGIPVNSEFDHGALSIPSILQPGNPKSSPLPLVPSNEVAPQPEAEDAVAMPGGW